MQFHAVLKNGWVRIMPNNPHSPSVLNIDIAFKRGDFALKVCASINALVTGLLGPSGSGKSTLLGLIAGLLRPDTGNISLGDRVLFDGEKNFFVPAHRRCVGLVFQDNQLFPHLNVRHNLLYGYQNLPVAQRRFELASVVELLDLAPLLARKPRQLSGGEQQRVALGRALLYSPQFLLLDEPLSALDKQLKEQILPFLARLREVADIPMLYVTHTLAEIEYLTDTWVTMESGRIIQD